MKFKSEVIKSQLLIFQNLMTNFYSNLIYLICFLIWFSKISFTVIKSRLDCVCISIYVSQGCSRQLSKYLPRLIFKAAFVLQGRLKEKKNYLFLNGSICYSTFMQNMFTHGQIRPLQYCDSLFCLTWFLRMSKVYEIMQLLSC